MQNRGQTTGFRPCYARKKRGLSPVFARSPLEVDPAASFHRFLPHFPELEQPPRIIEARDCAIGLALAAVFLPLLASALTAMHIYYVGLRSVQRPIGAGACLVYGYAAWWSLVTVFAGFAISTGYVVLNFVGFGAPWSQQRFLMWFLTTALAAAVGLTFFWSA